MLILWAEGPTVPVVCSPTGSFTTLDAFGFALALNPPDALLTAWALMLAAMMGPTLLSPLRHVRGRTFSRRRLRATLAFVGGYAIVWLIAGPALAAMTLALLLGARDAALPAAVALAWAWQSSPAKRRCLNGCHAMPHLAAFGTAADLDVLRFGLRQGGWCVGSCWALMLVCLLVPGGHIAAMAVLAIWAFLERLERPATPRWRPCPSVQPALIAAALARSHLGPLFRASSAK
ncbi:MAG: DUF2182 domain-containing protein [Methylobacterium radiotolerans]